MFNAPERGNQMTFTGEMVRAELDPGERGPGASSREHAGARQVARPVDIAPGYVSNGAMPRSEPPEAGTLLIATLLLLVLAFAGSWIIAYVQPGGDPWQIVPWFLLGAALIVVAGLMVIIHRARSAR